MKSLTFSYAETSLIAGEEIEREWQNLKQEIRNVRKALTGGYATAYASVNLPRDEALIAAVERAVKEKRAIKPAILVVVGIGGSNLGAMAVHEAVNGRLYNERSPPVRVYFADTVDEDKVSDILLLAESVLASGGNILVNVVTKSGATTETVALFEVFEGLLRRHKKKEWARFVVATTDKGSRLWEFALKENISLLEIPKNVGGRYSVFSAVGLFPLMMLGVDVRKLRVGAQDMLEACTKEDVMSNPAAVSAVIAYLHSQKGRNINDTFLFSTDLEGVGKWYRQLMGESIGKERNRKETKRLNAGITPTVSIGTTDLHSMAQLYLGGPQDKVTTFISVGRNRRTVKLPVDKRFDALVEKLQGRTLHEIMGAIMAGVKIAFKKGGCPYTEIILPDKSAYSVGQLLQFKMLEMMYIGFLLDVDPFNQPNVEAYKKETRKILADA